MHARFRQEPAGHEADNQSAPQHGQPRVPHDEPGPTQRRLQHSVQPVVAQLSFTDDVAEHGLARRRWRHPRNPRQQLGHRHHSRGGSGGVRFGGLFRFFAAAADDHSVSGRHLRSEEPISDSALVGGGRLRSRLLQRSAAGTAASSASEAQRNDRLIFVYNYDYYEYSNDYISYHKTLFSFLKVPSCVVSLYRSVVCVCYFGFVMRRRRCHLPIAAISNTCDSFLWHIYISFSVTIVFVIIDAIIVIQNWPKNNFQQS